MDPVAVGLAAVDKATDLGAAARAAQTPAALAQDFMPAAEATSLKVALAP